MCLDPGWMRNLKAVVYSRWVWKPGRSVALGEGPGVPGFWGLFANGWGVGDLPGGIGIHQK